MTEFIHKIQTGKIASATLLLYPDHDIPAEYLSGAVLDQDMVIMNYPAKEGSCIRGQIISEDYPGKPLLISIPLSQIAGFEKVQEQIHDNNI